MKVLQVVKTNIGATWAYEQANWLSKHDVDILTVLPEIEDGIAEKYKAENLKVLKADLSLPIFKPWKIFSKCDEFRKIVVQVNPDIIHFHFVTNIILGRIALKHVHIPRIFQVPGPLHLQHFFFKWFEIFFSTPDDFWVGACKKTCEIYRNSNIRNDHIFLGYYGGYGGKTCGEYQKASNILHQEFNIPDNRRIVGMVSYFYKPKKYLFQKRGIKGHEDFIDAISLVRKTHPEVVGMIIGGPWEGSEKYYKKVMAYAKSKCGSGIIFTGFRTDLKDIYRELAVAVHPSHSENLGGAAESLAARVPTVSTLVGGFPDIVIDGVTGYTVPPKNPDCLKDAIIKTIEDLPAAKIMADAGRQNVHELLDVEKCSRNILDIYKRILVSESEDHDK